MNNIFKFSMALGLSTMILTSCTDTKKNKETEVEKEKLAVVVEEAKSELPIKNIPSVFFQAANKCYQWCRSIFFA